MTLPPSLERLFAYAIAIESERLVREHGEGAGEQPPPIAFFAPADPRLELSIVIPAWNPKPEHLRRCLHSLRRANLAGMAHEIVVSDDASATDTVRRLCADAGLPALRYVRHETNLGGFGNFNWCLSAARGTWVHLLHQDDWIEPNFYPELLRHPAATDVAPLRYCRARLFFEDCGQTRLMFDEAPLAGVLTAFFARQAVCQRVQICGAIMRREELGAIGGYDGRLGTGADWEFWARWGARYPVYFSPEPLATYSLHGASWSARESSGERNATFLALHRKVIRRILDHVPPGRRPLIAQGGYRTVSGRLIEFARGNNRASRSAENQRLVAAWLPACVEHGLADDIARLLASLR